MYQITQSTPTLGVANKAFSVTEVNTIIADLLESGLPGHVWVEGEVSNYSSATSGHRYLSLKDGGSIISCALFRGSANRISKDVLRNLKNGDKVVIKASLSVYKPRGSYQLLISDIEPAGFGALAKAFVELKAKLDMEGLTSSNRKRPIPSWSKGIAVITSGTGAAIRDVVSTLARRAPFIPIVVYPSLVQGDDAPENIVNALQNAANNTNVDVILLVRGGGSLEDLMAFNDERVAMAIVKSTLPVITGVGHETDFTIADFVSDYRAATPTAAAEVVSPDKVALGLALTKINDRLSYAVSSKLRRHQQEIKNINTRLSIQHPLCSLQQQSQMLDELALRLQRGGRYKLEKRQNHLYFCYHKLLSNSPHQRLIRSRQQLSAIEERIKLLIQERLRIENQSINESKKSLTNISLRLDKHRQQLKGLDARLALLSPLGLLQRGYGFVSDEHNNLVKSVNAINKGDNITIQLADGTACVVVSNTYSNQ